MKLPEQLQSLIKKRRRGFTLIESLAVISIIGILLALGSYLFIQAEAQARDAQRKSDLNQISEAFSARYMDQTCSDPNAVGYYPGESLEQISGNNAWIKVSQLANFTDNAPYDCGSFSQYLPTIPNDVRSPAFNYYFNLATLDPASGTGVQVAAKHFRVTTSLEHQFAPGSPDQLECVRLSKVWINSFGGQPYDCDQQVISLGITPVIVSDSSTSLFLGIGSTGVGTGSTGSTGTAGTVGTIGTGGTICGTGLGSVNPGDNQTGTGGGSTCGSTGSTGTGSTGTGSTGTGSTGTGSTGTGSTGTNTTGPYNYYIGR